MSAPALYLWSDYGDSLFLARRLQAEGIRAQAHIAHETHRDCGRGLVPLVGDTPPKNAFVIFDATGHGMRGSFFRSRGHPVIGGNTAERDLERDRASGARLMVEHGITIPETQSFGTVKEAMAFVSRHQGEWYAKFSGDHATDLTHNEPDAEAMLRHLHWVEKRHRELVEGVELQRRVDGVEVSVEGAFDGHRFIPPFLMTFEDKKALTGNLGVRTGCESNVCCFLAGDLPALAALGVFRIEGFLRERGYVGFCDLNSIVTSDGTLYGLEWTARTGWDAFIAWSHLFDASLYDQLRAFAEGTLERWEPVALDQLALTLRLSVSPYPVEDGVGRMLAKEKGRPLDPALLEMDRATTVDVMLDDEGLPALAGASGHVGTVGAVGTSLPTLRKEVLAAARALRIPGKQFRIDPVKRVEKDWAALAELGLLRPLAPAREAAA